MTLPGEERRKAEMKTPNIGTELRPNGDVISFMHRQADLIEAEGHDVTASALREGIKALKSAPSELAGYYRDAMRYRWLKDHACNSLHLSRDGDHACNYVAAKKWIEEYSPEDFEECSPEELERMKELNTIWRLQIYPNTPVGFNVWNASSLDAVIDAAISAQGEKK